MNDFKTKVISAVRWFAFIRFLSQAFSWFMTLFVLRLLSKDDYGLFALATVLTSFLSLMSELGLGAVLIQKKDLSLEHTKKVFGIIILAGLTICITVAVLSPIAASFYRDSRLIPISIVLGLQFLFIPFQVIPQSMLERDLDFKKRSTVEFASAIIGGSVTLISALNGAGVWALVYGHITVSLTKVIGFNIAYPFKHMPSFNFKDIRDMLSFGSYTIGSRCLWFLYSNADIIIAGRLLNTESVGLYKFATHLASLPAQKINPIVNQVAFPAFSKIQGDTELVGAHYLKAVRLMSLIAFPILWGLLSIAPLIPNYLGEQWREAVPLLQIMCLVAPFRMLNSLTQPIINAFGRPEVSFKNQVNFAVILCASYLLGCYFWGLYGLVGAWAISFPVIMMKNLYRSLPIINLTLTRMLACIIRPAIISAIMAIIAISVRSAADGHTYDSLVLTSTIIAGAVAYTLLSLTFNKTTSNELIKIIRH
ncbi:MAG: colanic acid exporter [Gammaproteobacteria bacterium]|nr:MAG: colanic acid exporter [Gammaproteobacteria bacterium]